MKLTNEGFYIIGKRFNPRKQYNSKTVQGVVQYLGSVKNLLMPGMISGCLLRTYFLRKFSLYFSPSAWLSKIPAALFSLVHLVVKFTRKKTTLEHQYNISAYYELSSIIYNTELNDWFPIKSLSKLIHVLYIRRINI